MATIDHQEKLLAILQARGISLVADDIQWAFQSESTRKEAISWVDEYLGDSTLLTRDELDLYKSIGDTTKLELSSASHDVVPLQDRDIKEAIAALKSSTSAIEGHAKALEVQKEALLQLQRQKSDSNGASRLESKYAQEKTNLSFSVEDLSFSVNEQLKECENEAAKALVALRASSTERLAADSQVLEALSGISSKAISASSATPVNHGELEKWLQALAALRVAQVRTKIDSMVAKAGPMPSQEQLGDEGAELLTELHTLKDEIDSVVHMVIGHELRNPLMKGVEANEKGDREGRQAWSRYLITTMEYLIAQLDGATTRIVNLRHYADAILELRMIISKTEEETKPQDMRPTSLLLPTMPSSASLDIRSNPSSAPSTPSSLLPTALRKLNLGPTATSSTLAALTSDSHSKLLSQYAATEKAIIDTMGRSLHPQQQDALKVLGQLYATSSHGSVRLVDGSMDAKASDLGRRIDELAPKISGGDLR